MKNRSGHVSVRTPLLFLLKNIFHGNSKEKVIYWTQYFRYELSTLCLLLSRTAPYTREGSTIVLFCEERYQYYKRTVYSRTKQNQRTKKPKQSTFVICLNSGLGKDLVFSKETFHQEESYWSDYSTEGEQEDGCHEAELERPALDTILPLSEYHIFITI